MTLRHFEKVLSERHAIFTLVLAAPQGQLELILFGSVYVSISSCALATHGVLDLSTLAFV